MAEDHTPPLTTICDAARRPGSDSARPITRGLLIVGGSGCVVLGVIGIFVPLLPTTPFLLAAAALYARSSTRLLEWLLSNRWFGSYIRNYRTGRGIPRRDRWLVIGVLWVTMGVSVMAVPLLWVRVVLIAVALAVTWRLR